MEGLWGLETFPDARLGELVPTQSTGRSYFHLCAGTHLPCLSLPSTHWEAEVLCCWREGRESREQAGNGIKLF